METISEEVGPISIKSSTDSADKADEASSQEATQSRDRTYRRIECAFWLGMCPLLFIVFRHLFVPGYLALPVETNAPDFSWVRWFVQHQLLVDFLAGFGTSIAVLLVSYVTFRSTPFIWIRDHLIYLHKERQLSEQRDDRPDISAVIASLRDRAQRSRVVARSILILMIVTLAIGVAVFVSAPFFARSVNQLQKQAVDQLAVVSDNLVDASRAVEDLERLDTSLSEVSAIMSRATGSELEESSTLYYRLRDAYFDLQDVRNQFKNFGDASAIKERFESVQQDIKALLESDPAKHEEPIASEANLTRIGATLILLVALQTLGGLYRSHLLIAGRYDAIADVIAVAEKEKKAVLGDSSMLFSIESFTPRIVSAFGRRGPADAFLETLASVMGAARGKPETDKSEHAQPASQRRSKARFERQPKSNRGTATA